MPFNQDAGRPITPLFYKDFELLIDFHGGGLYLSPPALLRV